MNKVSEFKQKPFLHNGKITKGIGGRGGLTPKAIKKIQGHYGAAIRKNINNTDQMRKDILAIWEHRAKNHDNCGKWCPAKKNPPGDPDRNALHPHVTEVIKPVFETLTSETVLQKCEHGGTQNTNESVHNVIWARCPKTSFVGRSRLCLAVDDATIVYNEGERGRLPIFTELGMTVGHYTRKCFQDIDNVLITGSRARATPAAQLARRQRTINEAGAEDTRDYLSGAHE